MERIEIILLCIVGIISIVGMALGIITITKKDNNFSGTVQNPDNDNDNSGEQVVSIEHWLDSHDGKVILNSAVNSTEFAKYIKSFSDNNGGPSYSYFSKLKYKGTKYLTNTQSTTTCSSPQEGCHSGFTGEVREDNTPVTIGSSMFQFVNGAKGPCSTCSSANCGMYGCPNESSKACQINSSATQSVLTFT